MPRSASWSARAPRVGWQRRSRRSVPGSSWSVRPGVDRSDRFCPAAPPRGSSRVLRARSPSRHTGTSHPRAASRPSARPSSPRPRGGRRCGQARNSRALGARLRAIAVLDPGLVEAQSPAMMALHHHDRDPDEDAGAIRAIEAERTLDHAIAALPPGADVEPDVLFQQPAERDRRSVRESRSARDGLSRLRTRARGDARRVTSGHRPCRVPGADPSARDRGRP